MKTYKVFTHPSKEVNAVKTGFAWLALILLPFLPVWFLFRGLWKFFIAYVLIILILASIDYEIYGELGFFNFSNSNDLQIIIVIIEMVILLMPAFKGNEWTSMNLLSKGYKVSFSVQASSKKEALKLAQQKKINYDVVY